MAINSLNETKTLHRLADLLGLKSGASQSQDPASGQTSNIDKMDNSERPPAAPNMPQTPATGF